MTFNRDDYLIGNFNKSSKDEVRNFNATADNKGIDWNNYIKDYLIKMLSVDICEIDTEIFLSSISFADFTVIILLLQSGLFGLAATKLATLSCTEDSLVALKDKWEPLIIAADDTLNDSSDSSDESIE